MLHYCQKSCLKKSENCVPRITIGVLGQPFGPKSSEKYKKKIESVINSISKDHSLESKYRRDRTKDKECFLFQTLDSSVPQQGFNKEDSLKILKDHRIKFSKQGEYCFKKDPSKPIKACEGSQFLYYPTAYAKMLFGWHQFEGIFPSNCGDDYFKNNFNRFVRVVPIDHTIGKNDKGRKKLRKIISHLDGVVFPGGDSLFYDGIQEEGLKAKQSKMNPIQLMQEFIRHSRAETKSPVTRTKTQYFEGLSQVLKIIKEINTGSRKIPVLAIGLGFQGVILDYAADMRLDSTSDQFQYHEVVPVERPCQHAFQAPLLSLGNFMHSYYKNPKYFPGVERNAYFNHTKSISRMHFLKNKNLLENFKVLAVSFVDDRKIKNSQFNDADHWDGPQKKQLIVFPSNFDAIQHKINNNHKIFFNKKASGGKIKPDFRLQLKNNFPFIYKTIKLLKGKLSKKISSDLRENYERFLKDANQHLDKQLNRKHPEKFLKKKINTNFTGYSNEFVSMVEGKKDPIYGLQFHIEKSLHNFHRNPYVKNMELPRLKDQMIAKFFLKRVFDESVKNLNVLSQDYKQNEILYLSHKLNNMGTHISSHQKLLPHLHPKQTDFFNYSLLSGNIICEKNPKTNEKQMVYSLNNAYNNNLSEQVLRDCDDFYREILGPNENPLGMGQRFVLRSIDNESEVLVFKKIDAFDLGSALDYSKKK